MIIGWLTRGITVADPPAVIQLPLVTVGIDPDAPILSLIEKGRPLGAVKFITPILCAKQNIPFVFRVLGFLKIGGAFGHFRQLYSVV
jgi:hypothetical protein